MKTFSPRTKKNAVFTVFALLLILCCAAAGCATAPAGGSGQEDEGISSMPSPDDDRPISKKRAGPAPVMAVSKGGVKYVAVQWGKARGLPQNGGYIAAVDETTGRELWLLSVYDVEYDPSMEEDKQDVFITRLSLARTPDRLLIEDERGRCYSVDLKTKWVSTVDCR